MSTLRFVRRSSLIIFIGILLAFVLFGGYQAVAYDGQTAAEYARYFAWKVCSDGYYWVAYWVDSVKYSQLWSYTPGTSVGVVQNDLDSQSGTWRGVDCAHFVSCCIGSPATYAGHSGGGLDVPSRGGAYGEPGADRLVSWLLNSDGTGVSSLGDMEPGDVIAYDWDWDLDFDHVALYLGNNKVAAHSDCCLDEDWHLGRAAGSFNYRFIHISETAAPIASASDITDKPSTMYPDTLYQVTAKYYDPQLVFATLLIVFVAVAVLAIAMW